MQTYGIFLGVCLQNALFGLVIYTETSSLGGGFHQDFFCRFSLPICGEMESNLMVAFFWDENFKPPTEQ